MDIPHWGVVSERDLEKETGIPKIILLNDFVANGYGIVNLEEEDMLKIYEPEETGEKRGDKVRVVFGVGTGLGVAYMARPSEKMPFYVYPSEGGIVKMPLYNKQDREYWKFLKDIKKIEREDVSMLLAGQALPWIAEFLSKEWIPKQ